MPSVEANGITFAYEIEGPEDAPVLLMIHGLGAQLTRWPRGLCDRFIDAGFRILRMDNRDVGLSSHMNAAGIPDLAAITAAVAAGRTPQMPYSLSDMAADGIALLDALAIERAHVVGVSLGGMIAQVLGIEHGPRIRSLAIVMSQSGNPDLPGSNKEALAVLMQPAPDPAVDREAYIAHQVNLNRTLGSPAYPADEADLRRFAGEAADRAYDPSGSARQLAASRGSPDRRESLRALDLPTVVIHGADDILIPPAGGEDVADHIARAWYVRVGGMAHDLPEPLFDLFVSVIAANCRRAA